MSQGKSMSDRLWDVVDWLFTRTVHGFLWVLERRSEHPTGVASALELKHRRLGHS